MKIYEEIVIDMNPESSTFGETLYEDSFQYFGDLHLLQRDEDEDETAAQVPLGGAMRDTRSTADLAGTISSSRVITTGLDPSLQSSLQTYLDKKSLIKTPENKKATYIIDRFDGGLNLSKSPRDLSYWESPRMDEMMPSKAGRLIRLGDFATTALSLSSAFSAKPFDSEGYGLYYFTVSNNFASPSVTGTISKCVAYQDSDDINVRDITNSATTSNLADTTNTSSYKPVFHSGRNRVYVSDASLTANTSDTSLNTQMFGIIDKAKYFPIEGSATGDYNVGANDGSPAVFNKFLDAESLIIDNPSSGTGSGNIHVANSAEASDGIAMHISFASAVGTGGWTSPTNTAYFYEFFASYLYDEGSETGMTSVSDIITSGTSDDDDAEVMELNINEIAIDWTAMQSSHPRVHGCRFYYRGYSDGTSGNTPLSSEPYLFGELDFRYGFKVQQSGAGWHEFENDPTDHADILVQQANGTKKIIVADPDITLTYFSNNFYHEGEIKKDIMWKTSTMGNGVAFIGNIKYDFLSDGTGGKHFPTTMLYCGAGESTGGPIYPQFGVFPIDSNRLEAPKRGGEITALVWYADRILQFREHCLYVVNVQDVINPMIEGRFEGIGVSGQYATTRTPNGVAIVNESGVYEYNGDDAIVRSLTSGKIDTSEFNADSTSKIGYDDKAKMLIVGNYGQRASDYHYAYSYITDSWCTWNTNAASYSTLTNFDVDHDGYLTGGVDDNDTLNIYKWSDIPTTIPSVEYITKDIDFDNPGLNKRLYTLYISYIGGTSNSITMSFRVNGREGKNLSNNWIDIGTVYDYTDPYGDSTGNAWDTSGSPTSGDPYSPSGDGLDSSSTTEQKLAKVNFLDMANATTATLPKDYFKFARSIQLKFAGTGATTFEINDISLVYKPKRLK